MQEQLAALMYLRVDEMGGRLCGKEWFSAKRTFWASHSFSSAWSFANAFLVSIGDSFRGLRDSFQVIRLFSNKI